MAYYEMRTMSHNGPCLQDPKDTDAFYKILTQSDRCGYPPNNVDVINGKKATRQGILDGFDRLEQRLKADHSGNSTAIIYYSGHGWREKPNQANYYLIPYDVREDRIGASAIRANDIAEIIASLNAQRLLDCLYCCHSGGMGIKAPVSVPDRFTDTAIPAQLFFGDQKAVSPADGTKGLEDLAEGSGRAVLSSSQANQSSYIRKDGQMSIFTYHLIEAFTGHAQPLEGATDVLVSDVMGHVYRRVPQSSKSDWNKEQNPDYQMSGNFPVALLLGGKGLSKGQKAPDPLSLNARKNESKMSNSGVYDQHGQDIGRDQYNIGHMGGGFFQPNMDAEKVYQADGDMLIHNQSTMGKDIDQASRPISNLFEKVMKQVQSLSADEQTIVKPLLEQIRSKVKRDPGG